jgi:hypothetical protein
MSHAGDRYGVIGFSPMGDATRTRASTQPTGRHPAHSLSSILDPPVHSQKKQSEQGEHATMK